MVVSCAWVIFLVLVCASTAWSQRRAVVLRGEEIIVSYEPSRDSFNAAEYVISHLRLPPGLVVSELYPTKNMATISTSATTGVRGAPIEVDQSDVDRVCEQVLHVNRGIPLHCEANRLRFLSRTTNDPSLGTQYALTKLSAFDAWDFTVGAPSVVVAIVDTGVYYNHPDLSANIAVNAGEVPANGIDDDTNGYVDDYVGYDFYNHDSDPVDENGHGTHCAGIVAARGDNEVGVAGIAWGSSVLPVRVLGPGGGGNDGDVAAGVLYAAQRGAAVLSLSLGGDSPSAVIDSAIDYARSVGALVVVAAGNESNNNDVFPSYPANSEIDNIVSVAATDSADGLATFSSSGSNYGLSTVDLAAPGKQILSTYLAGSYANMSGTSMATPYVAGVAALMKSVNPALTYADLKAGLFQSVDPLSSLKSKVATGGRINAYRAAYLASTGVPLATTPISQPGQEDSVRRLTLASKRYGRRALLYGHIKNSVKVAVAKKYVYLQCDKITARRARSDSDGYFAFRVTRPRRSEKCYAYDSFQNRSRSVTVR